MTAEGIHSPLLPFRQKRPFLQSLTYLDIDDTMVNKLCADCAGHTARSDVLTSQLAAPFVAAIGNRKKRGLVT